MFRILDWDNMLVFLAARLKDSREILLHKTEIVYIPDHIIMVWVVIPHCVTNYPSIQCLKQCTCVSSQFPWASIPSITSWGLWV
jgi:hypothetical protein